MSDTRIKTSESEIFPSFDRIERQFSRALETYNQQAVVQNLMAERLNNSLRRFYSNGNLLNDVLPTPDSELFPLNVLELGAGTGLFTQKILRWLPIKSYYTNDLVARCRPILEAMSPKIRFLSGNALELSFPTESVNLLLSNALFQWLPLPQILTRVSNWLVPNGILAFSTFTQGNLRELALQTSTDFPVSLKYRSVPETRSIIEQAGFVILEQSNFQKTVTFDSGMELLRHLKYSGVNAATAKPWTISQVRRYCQQFEISAVKPTLTYCSVNFICRKLR